MNSKKKCSYFNIFNAHFILSFFLMRVGKEKLMATMKYYFFILSIIALKFLKPSSTIIILTPGKNCGIAIHTECSLWFFYLAIGRLVTDGMQNVFYLIVEHSGFIKYTLNKPD